MTKKTENDTEKQADFIKEADEANGIKIANGVDAAMLLSYIERVERLEEKKKALSNDIKEVFEEAKYNKIDVSALREILKMRKKDEQERIENEFIVEQYKIALGMDKMLTKRKAIVGVKREKSGGVRLTCGTRFFTSRILRDWGDVIDLRNDLDRLIREAAGKETETE